MTDPEAAPSAPLEAKQDSNPPVSSNGNDTEIKKEEEDTEMADANMNSSENVNDVKEEAVKEESTTTNDAIKEEPAETTTTTTINQPKIEEAPEETSFGRRPRRSRTAAVEAMEALKAKPEPKKTPSKKSTPPAAISQATLQEHQKRQEAMDRLNIGRLVEQFKHVAGTGQYYPHHGNILEKLAAEGRIPERYVVQWQDPNSNSTNSNTTSATASILRRDEWTNEDLEEHDAMVENWQNPFRMYNARRPEKTRLGQPLKNSLEKLRERYHHLVVRDMQHDSFGKYSTTNDNTNHSNSNAITDDDDEEHASGDLLPTLVLIAALEDALQTSLQYQQAKQVEREQSEGTEVIPKKKKQKNPLLTMTHPPLYYSTNPNQYLTAPSREADAQEDLQLLQAARNPKAVVTPAVLAQRIRDGCSWAWTYLQQQQQELESDGPKPLDAPAHSAISATAMELEAKKAQEALLFPPDANEQTTAAIATQSDATAEQQQQQRRSVRSGLGERGSLFDPASSRSTRGNRGGGGANYADSSYTPEPNVVQKGGRVAMWWLQTLEQEAKERSKAPKEKKSKEIIKEAKEEEKEMPDVQESKEKEEEAPLPDKTEAAAASNMITGDSYEEALGGGNEDEETATKDDDTDFDIKSGDDEDSDDDELENVEKERSLTPVPDLEESEDDDDEADDDSEEEEVDEEHAIVWDNPYLTPSVPAILEYLSKPKSISGEDVQKAMDEITLRHRHNKRTTSYGLPIHGLQSCDKALLHWENPDHPSHGSLVLKCVSGETVNELQRMDAQNFGRCKFELEIIGLQEKTIQIRNREDFEQRQEDYKIRKTHDKWRFKGVHEGHAYWPQWNESAKEWIAKNVVATIEEQAPSVPTAASNDDDEALAKKLAEEAQEEEALASRRTGRRSRSKGIEGGGGSGVFYGNQSSMTQKQLMDALIRLVKAQGMGTLSGLQELVSDDSSDPLRRIRIALGKILWKQNRLAKLPVSSQGSDEKLLKQLSAGKPLLAIKQQVVEEEKEETSNSKDSLELLEYLSHLHTTELRLRNLVLKQLGKIPLPIIATAADERRGTLENMDAGDFEDPSQIEWKTVGSDLISKLVYRPNVDSTLGDEHTPCYWYKITSWSESIASEAEDAEDDAVERRKRFQVVPHGHAGNTLLLTEAQVAAGRHAATLQEQYEKSLAESNASGNPFATEIGDRITLVAIDDEGDDAGSSNEKAPSEIAGRVVGQDTILDADDSGDLEYRILILPDDNSSGESSPPFWAVLDVRADDASFVCQPQGQTKWYSIENQDFHVDSEPYKACQGVLEWLSRQSKAGPFLQPVDPVALGIPSYPDIVKHPMDISTMTEKLENGAYSNILPGQSVGNSLVCRMLNGPFRKDIELIFDNAMLFNPPDDWIAMAAASLKKSVGKKIDTLAYNSEKKHTSGSTKKSIYADEDSDVDMYEYESDHDEEYTTSRRGKRKRGPQARASSNKDEAAARPMEQQIRLQNCLKDGNDLRGRFSGLPLNGFASTYSMPPNWSCKKAASAAGATEKESDNEDDDSEEEDANEGNQEHVQEMADLLALQKRFGEAEASSLRRSSREVRTTSSRRSNRDKKKDGSKKTEGLEYYRVGQEEESLSTIPSSRLDVEVLLEKRHEEYYAKLYSTYETELVSSFEESGFALYSSGSFPPYLGRVVPSKNSHGFTWEIRPPFCVPALRWVLRGLIVSGHLTAVEPMFSTTSTTGIGTYDYTSSGVIISNDVYYHNPETCKPFEVLDTRVLQRKKRAGKSDESSEDEVEMSEYEKLRAERVARNAERLKALGLA